MVLWYNKGREKGGIMYCDTMKKDADRKREELWWRRESQVENGGSNMEESRRRRVARSFSNS